MFVKSKLNEGSTFGFWLPISKEEIVQKSLEVVPKEVYQELKIEKLEDYNTKAKLDNEFVGIKEDLAELAKPNLVFDELNPNNNNPIRKDNLISHAIKEENITDEWEISFEVRDN